jgi:predicted nucleotidyltransferase
MKAAIEEQKLNPRNLIDQMVSRIISRYNPDKIILFGSQAQGRADGDSDVDLLVVMPVQGAIRTCTVEIGVMLNDIPVSKDIVVTRPADFERRRYLAGTIEGAADREGQVLYSRKR